MSEILVNGQGIYFHTWTINGVNLDFGIAAVGATPSDRKVVDWEFKEYIKCVRAKWFSMQFSSSVSL